MTEEGKKRFVRNYETDMEFEMAELRRHRKYSLIYLGVLCTMIATFTVLKFMGYFPSIAFV